MLEYMPRLAYNYRLDMESVVLYIGRGAGVGDTGIYQVNGLEGAPTLSWRYRVLRLWQIPAETLLATDRVAPLALVGQTQITHPEVTLPAVVARMRRVAEGELRGRLLTAFLALLPDEEMVSMVERVLEEEDLLLELDLPYLRRLREKSRTEGLAEGRAEGRAEGGAEMLLRLLHVRFGPLSEEVTARVNAAAPEMLLHWSERVLSASTLDAVFAE
jgi:hypothetical protein